MENNVRVGSSPMGRKPADNPKGVHLGIRIDEDMLSAIDAEQAKIQKEFPGLKLKRSDVVRMLLERALGLTKRK
jgi:hypothetical protein